MLFMKELLKMVDLMELDNGQTRKQQPKGLKHISTVYDSASNGELLRGWWQDGIPVGPFESTENMAKTLLCNVRVMFATCVALNSNVQKKKKS